MTNLKTVGTLYVVATPIGNLKDISARGLEVLRQVDTIAAEDTRHAATLLKHFSITKPMISLHEFNEREKYAELVQMLQDGKNIALVSDAGTPLISDPGFRLVRAAQADSLPVVPVPGACAAIAALSAAGLPSDRFVFEGFLPPKQEARESALRSLLHEERTMIFYEAPHRLLVCLESMASVFGEQHEATVAREITKLHESIKTNTLKELVAFYRDNPDKQRGEVVLLLHGALRAERNMVEVDADVVLRTLVDELPLKQAAAIASKITGLRKNDLYQRALDLKG